MGAEELEPEEFEPFFASIEGTLQGRKIGLFGSYEWADGEWMRTWQARTEAAGGIMIADGVTAYGYPIPRRFRCRTDGEGAPVVFVGTAGQKTAFGQFAHRLGNDAFVERKTFGHTLFF